MNEKNNALINTAVISKQMLNKKPVLDMKMRLMNNCLGPITVLN